VAISQKRPATPSPVLLEIALLGEFRLVLDGRPGRLAAPPKTKLVLAQLLLHHGAVERERIAFALWPDARETEGRANLRRHLYHLQRALPTRYSGTPWLSTSENSVSWIDGTDVRVDTSEFERLANDVQKRSAALELYRGDLLESSDEEWLAPHRAHLRARYLSLLEELLLEARRERRFEQARAYAEKLLAADPWREDALRQLMAIRYESGDRGGALHDYERFAASLDEELGVPPMPETRALRDRVLGNEPIPTTASEQQIGVELARRPGRFLIPLVGRDDELSALKECWSRATGGLREIVLVAGEGGIGKTRLASEFALFAEAQGARVLYGATTYPERLPYMAIGEALRNAVAMLESNVVDPLWLSVLARAVPSLRRWLPDMSEPPPIDPQREQSRIFEAFAITLEALAKPRPLLLVLEDLHWAGVATLAALCFLAERRYDSSLMILGTYRDDEVGAARQSPGLRRLLQSSDAVTHVALGRLSGESVAQALEVMPELGGQAQDVGTQLYVKSEGNPLFLTYALSDLLDRPVDGATIAQRGLDALIAARLERLSAPARALVEIASVIGDQFDVETAREVSGWPEGDVLDALNEVMDRGLVRESRGGSAFDCSFTHHLVRTQVYGRLPLAVCRRRHRRVGHVLERAHQGRGATTALDLAMHYDRGGLPERAASWYLDAAESALQVGALDEALAHAERAAAVTGRDSERFAAAALEERVHGRRGDRTLQRKALDAVAGYAEKVDADESRAEALWRRVQFHRSLGERRAEAAAIERLAALADNIPEPHWRARVELARAVHWTLVNRYGQARAAAEAALALEREAGDVDGEVETLCQLSSIARQTGENAQAHAFVEAARGCALSSQSRNAIAHATLAASRAAFHHQEFESAHELAREAAEEYRSLGDAEGEATALSAQAPPLSRRLHLREARECYLLARSRFEAIAHRQGVAVVLANLGSLDASVGCFDQALEKLEQARGIFTELNDRRGLAICAIAKAFITIHRADVGPAMQQAREGLELADAIGDRALAAGALSNLGTIEREAGQYAAAIEHLQQGAAAYRGLGLEAEIVHEHADLALAHAELGAVAAAMQALSAMRSVPENALTASFWPHYPYWIASRAAAKLGDPTMERELLARAHSLLLRMAAAIDDEPTKAAFLALAASRAIVAARARV
jgi:DNA-binding SARP family transcriptional activator/tetratricopeptide (TPR) repeat protein